MKKEEYEKTKLSPIIFAVLLILILLMFAIGKYVNKHKPTTDDNRNTTTTVEVVVDDNQEDIQ